ncbi:MAG: winged helix-turn-helix transcriptional regulator [Burkholderiales bacterium]|nr:MAG: winged helix-turn-helix transcriptional regulator [Betaproteobacteria bacterium]TAG24793.1 MAG: winged helix-turn-helix transcriptional regulator [Burkholderiales bacterium]TAG47990.1 MAG: winged helix-turn-helix transcriptional regulator [Betaproteobacteria bacterium]
MPPAETAAAIKPADMIDGLRKGLEVICAFDDGTPRLTQSELAARLSLSRAAARRYLMTLTALGYMATDGRSFWLTPKVMRLGQSFLASSRLPQTVLPVLQKLTNTLGESTNLSVIEGNEAVYLCRAAAPKLVSTTLEPGTRIPIYAATAGRVLLSFLSDAALDATLAKLKIKAHCPSTETNLRVLKKAIVTIRRQGYGVTENQFEMGLRGVSVPLVDESGRAVAAISVSMSTAAMSAAQAVKLCIPALREAAASLRSQL